MDCTVHGVTKSQTRLSDFHFFTFLQLVGARCENCSGLGTEQRDCDFFLGCPQPPASSFSLWLLSSTLVGCPFTAKEHHSLQIIFTLWVKLLGLSQFSAHFSTSRASLVPQMVKNPPAMQETWVLPVGWEDPLEEGMATHSSILAWRILTDRGTWWATVHGVTKSQT